MKIPFALLPLLCLMACRDPKVAEVLSQFQGKSYLRSAETEMHKIEIRYLPETYQVLARSNLDGESLLDRRRLDSLGASGHARPGIAFLLNLSVRDTLTGRGLENDVVYGGMGGFPDYQKTLEAYRFGLKEKIWLESDGKRYPMASYTMEDSWGMTSGRTFFLIFGYPEGKGPGKKMHFDLVLDGIVPGTTRKKIEWNLPTGKYDALIQ